METIPEGPSRGLRHALWVGAACVLALAVGVWLVFRFSAPPSPGAQRPEVAGESRPAPPPMARVEPPRPPPGKVVLPSPPPPRPRTPPSSGSAAEPEPSAPPPEEAASADPFEPEEGKDPHIRTLVAVGDIQLGVIRESARIRDEAGLKRVLVRIGDDLEKRIQQKQQQGEPGLQQVLDEYREELGKYMDGMVELSGPGFRVGTEVGPPQPRERWWKPRAQ